MKQKKLIKLAALTTFPFLVLLGFTLFSGAGLNQQVLTPFLAHLQEKHAKFTDYKPEDRVYLQLDKPFYVPGEDVWFSAYLRDAAELKPSGKSDIVHVEFINPRGTVTSTIQLITKDGMAAGDFHIDENAPGGLYKIRAFTQWQQNDADILAFEREITVQKSVLPRLKMKLDFDRKAFGAGDAVVASLDLQTNDNAPLGNQLVKVRSSLGGQPLLNQEFTTDATGKTKITFTLPADLATNDGLVNVLIDYEGLTESISRSIPIVLNKMELTLFPEGGDMVSGLPARVAFSAKNEFGKAADVEGTVINSAGKTVATFTSYHMGMGAFTFTPVNGETYTAKITKPEGVKQTYALPRSLPQGFALSVSALTKTDLSLDIHSTLAEPANIVAQMRGKIYWATGVQLGIGKNHFSIPLGNLPMGVAHVTLFDSKGIPRAERLVFVNRDKQMKVNVKTNKEKYMPREKVEMAIDVTDERGMPLPALLSMSVVNDQLLSFADDKQGNILSKMMLEYDLKGKVEESAFYFDTKEEKSGPAMDFLMMTSGWRRFEWKQVLNGEMPALSFQGERARVAGIVYNELNQPISHAQVIDLASGKSILTDKEGKYEFASQEFSFPMTLQVSGIGRNPTNIYAYQFGENYNTVIYKPAPPVPVSVLGAVPGGITYNWTTASVLCSPSAGAAINLTPAMDNGVFAFQDATVFDMDAEEVVEAEMEPDMAGDDFKPAAGRKEMPMKEEVAFDKKKDDGNADFGLKNIVLEDDPGQGVEKRERNRKQGEVAQNFRAGFFADDEMGNVADMRDSMVVAWGGAVALPAANQFYRARVFPVVEYATTSGQPADDFERTDFRSTVYWNPRIEVDRSGHATVEFYNSDEITSFRTTVEGIGFDGSVGRTESVHYTQMPFSMTTKIPAEVATEDVLEVPVILKNNTDQLLTGSLEVKSPDGLDLISTLDPTTVILPGQVKTIFLTYKANRKPGKGNFRVNFRSQGIKDAFTQEIKVTPKGFPVNMAFSGNQREAEYNFEIRNLVDGSLVMNFTAFPSVMSDLLKGIEGILAEPYGCFEQTSTSSYPNVLVMQYLKDQTDVDPALVKRANSLLDAGYKRLTGYETKDKGYEWFGSSPPHEALTAYGLMQFNDMKGVYGGVSQEMIDRTAAWLMTRRDGKGGFLRDGQALDNFGRADADVTNAYIVYALAEAGYTDIRKELDAAYNQAMQNKDPYQLALVANAMFSFKDITRGNTALAALNSTQAADGSFMGKKHSITYSTDGSLRIETTALAALAILKSGNIGDQKLQSSVKFLVGSRNSYGGFGTTQGTILSLKALTRFTIASKRTPEDGTIEIYVDGKKVSTKEYKAGEQNAIEVKELENCLSEGKHKVKVVYVGTKNPLPYMVKVGYSTSLPASSRECKVTLATKLSETETQMGETVRLSASLTNLTQDGLPMTMAIIGIPAGLSAQPWQLKEMQEKGVFDFYEVIGSNLVAYYRQMKPGEVREINLDLKAEVPGSFEAPASSAYLYYTPEYKFWCAVPKVTVSE